MAKQDKITAKFIKKEGDEGVFMVGPYGEGWYHTGTSADQVFIGHEDARDFYLFDFQMQPDGNVTEQGNDMITHYDVNDQIGIINDGVVTGEPNYSEWRVVDNQSYFGLNPAPTDLQYGLYHVDYSGYYPSWTTRDINVGTVDFLNV